MHMDDLIRNLVEENLHPEHMELINESYKHAGHAGDDGSGQTHYKLMVVSTAYECMSMVEAQRLTMRALKTAFDKGLHSISLKLRAPVKKP